MTTLLSPLLQGPQAKAPTRAGLRQFNSPGYQSPADGQISLRSLTPIAKGQNASPSTLAEPFITAREVAAKLCVHQNFVYDQAASGRMPSYKISGLRRFRWSEIETWLAPTRCSVSSSNRSSLTGVV
jgi:excisionase family DNA binding protein